MARATNEAVQVPTTQATEPQSAPAVAPPPAPPQVAVAPSTAQVAGAPKAVASMVKAEEKALRVPGTYHEPEEVAARIGWANRNAFLVSPATSVSALPQGCSIAFSQVWIDLSSDVHDVGFGKVALLKHAIEKIAAAAGISFDFERSRRMDNGADPHYVHWKAVGAWRHLDGSVIPIGADKEMDLREGSAQVQEIFAKAKTDDKAETQLRQMRAFIVRHAQSKAELAAIRKHLQIRSYTPEELRDKPFIVAKLMFTGQSDNPEIARDNAAAIRNNMLGGMNAMFGPAPSAAPVPAMQAAAALPAAAAPFTPGALPAGGHQPPPIGSVPADMDDDYDKTGPNVYDAPAEPPSAQPRAPAQASKARAPARGGRGGGVFKFGKSKGVRYEDAEIKDLEWYAGALKQSIDDPSKEQYREGNEADLRAVNAEIARREGEPPVGGDY